MKGWRKGREAVMKKQRVEAYRWSRKGEESLTTMIDSLAQTQVDS